MKKTETAKTDRLQNVVAKMRPPAAHSFPDILATSDLNQAAFLLALGHEMRAIDGDRWRRFIFDASAAEDAARFHDDAPVPARRFVRGLRDVRALLHHSR
jgi:hypothetical protein